MKQELSEMIHQLKSGNQSVFQEFYHEIYPSLYHIAYKIVKSEADAKDIVQSSIIIIHKCISQLKDDTKFYGWANRIVVTTAYRHLQHMKKVPMTSYSNENYAFDHEECRFYMQPQLLFEHENQIEILSSLIAQLKPSHQEILTYVYIQQKSMKEVSELLDIPIGTVKTRALSARRELKRIIEAYEMENDYKFAFHSFGAFGFFFGFSLFQHIQSIHKKIKTSNLLKSLLVTGTISCSIIAVQYNKPSITTPRISIQESSFPTVIYKSRSISSSRSAYFTLLNFAHTQEGMHKKSQQELNEIQSVLDAINTQDTPYREHLERMGWMQWFKSAQIHNTVS